MISTITAKTLSATDLMLALSDYLPEATHGAVPLADQRDALEAYLAFEDGSLAEVPRALDVYNRRYQNYAE